jgi:hypothetical protein
MFGAEFQIYIFRGGERSGEEGADTGPNQELTDFQPQPAVPSEGTARVHP